MITPVLRILFTLSFTCAALAQEKGQSATAKPVPATPAAPALVISLRDVQGLWGGNNIDVYSDDHCVITRVTSPKKGTGLHELRFEAQLPAGESRRLLKLADSTHFLDYRQGRKTGVPDEALPKIKIPVPGAAAFEATKWANEKDAKFDPLYHALLKLAETTKPGRILHDGPLQNKKSRQ
jgi:hypothetical protein